MQHAKLKNPNKLEVRDFITLGIFWVLYFIVYSLGSPLCVTVVGNFFIHGACGILWGITFPLLCIKVNKPGIVFLYTALIGLVQIMNLWVTGLIIITGAVVAELVWRKMDRKNFKTIAICHVLIVCFMYLGMFLPLLLLSDVFLTQIPEYSLAMFTDVYNFLSATTYMFFVGLVAAILGTLLGALLGKKLLKKHFIKAGII